MEYSFFRNIKNKTEFFNNGRGIIMKKDIVLASTNKGYLSTHFWTFIWFVAFWIFNSWCEGYIGKIGRYDFPWPQFGYYGSFIWMILAAMYNFYVAIYSARTVNVLQHGADGYLGKIICSGYEVPFSKTVSEKIFNRVIKITVEQESLSRLLNTGNLELEFLTFTNADSKEWSLSIPAIRDPYGRKKEIESSLLNHEGLLIKK